MGEATWEIYNCPASRSPDGVITLENIEPGYEYRVMAHLMQGYTVMRVMRRKSDALAAQAPATHTGEG